jgi:probable rRNA maturation factor
LEVTVLNRQRGHRVDCAALIEFLRRVVREAPAAQDATLAVCLVSDGRMRDLNRRFRGSDRPTDVLSFPAGDAPPPDEPRHLGDIVISVATAARQASGARHSLERELKLLALHGYLHLLGYDHERDDGRMLRVQARLAGRLLAGGAP